MHLNYRCLIGIFVIVSISTQMYFLISWKCYKYCLVKWKREEETNTENTLRFSTEVLPFHTSPVNEVFEGFTQRMKLCIGKFWSPPLLQVTSAVISKAEAGLHPNSSWTKSAAIALSHSLCNFHCCHPLGEGKVGENRKFFCQSIRKRLLLCASLRSIPGCTLKYPKNHFLPSSRRGIQNLYCQHSSNMELPLAHCFICHNYLELSWNIRKKKKTQ